MMLVAFGLSAGCVDDCLDGDDDRPFILGHWEIAVTNHTNRCGVTGWVDGETITGGLDLRTWEDGFIIGDFTGDFAEQFGEFAGQTQVSGIYVQPGYRLEALGGLCYACECGGSVRAIVDIQVNNGSLTGEIYFYFQRGPPPECARSEQCLMGQTLIGTRLSYSDAGFVDAN